MAPKGRLYAIASHCNARTCVYSTSAALVRPVVISICCAQRLGLALLPTYMYMGVVLHLSTPSAQFSNSGNRRTISTLDGALST